MKETKKRKHSPYHGSVVEEELVVVKGLIVSTRKRDTTEENII